MAQFVSDEIYAIKRVVEKEGLDCEFELRRSFDVLLDAEEAEEVAGGFLASLKAGQKWTRDVDLVDAKYVEQITSMKGAKAALSVPACSFWPYKFVSQLLANLEKKAVVNLQTNTPVTQITQDEAGRSIIHTSRGTLRARKVVFATNGYTAGLCPQYAGKIVPVKATASHISPAHGTVVSPHLSHTYNISYPLGPGHVDYLNPRPDGGIVVGGGKWIFAHDRSLWYGNWDDSTLLPGVQQHFDGLMQQHFNGWEDSGAEVDSIWTGIQGYTADEKPHIGEVPGMEGLQYMIAGFNGGGMAMIFLCAKGLAEMVGGGVPYARTGLPGSFKATRERLETHSVVPGMRT
ncbi:hypothetical protein LTR08_007552 [Meristemomyces frigidus]|nr:hypothetical protein LTR08_007552 [Meristemomyces frigidus]